MKVIDTNLTFMNAIRRAQEHALSMRGVSAFAVVSNSNDPNDGFEVRQDGRIILAGNHTFHETVGRLQANEWNVLEPE